MNNNGSEGKGKVIAILGAITALVVAITTLVSVLGENNLLDFTKAETEASTTEQVDHGDDLEDIFPTKTPLDSDVELPAPEPVTAEPETTTLSAPTCTNFTAFTGKAKNNAIIVGYTQNEFWVGYSDLPDAATAHGSLTGYIFDTSEAAQNCLRNWVKYLGAGHTANWPSADSGKGHGTHEVWMSVSNPPLVGELANWPLVPDMIVVAVVDETMNPQYVQIYECSASIPAEDLGSVAFWHVGTSAEALQGYVELYESNGYEVRDAMGCP